MVDDPFKKCPHDRSRINTSEDHEMRYRSRKLGVPRAAQAGRQEGRKFGESGRGGSRRQAQFTVADESAAVWLA
jgi:hypothetical protein